MTSAQQRAITEYWPAWGIDYAPVPINPEEIFGRRAPLIVEIGIGNGELLTEMAGANPASDFIGIEVHEPGVGHCLLRLHELGLKNVRLIRHDAIDVLTRQIPDASLQGVNLFFPDPWPKKRHHKRRIVQPAFIDLLGRKIRSGGTFHVATDWVNYADHIEAIVDANPAFRVAKAELSKRPETRFELRGKRLGHEIRDLIYLRV